MLLACKRHFDAKYDLNKPSVTREEIINNWGRVTHRNEIKLREVNKSEE